jgi:hypothetical protein
VDILQNILGGGQQRQQIQDFTNRYNQGSPYDGISDDEVRNHYQQIAPHLSPEMYEQAAQESYGRMAPQERQQFGRQLQQYAQQQGVNFPDMNRDGIDDRLQDPRYLAQMTSQIHQQQPNLLGQILGGGGGGGGGGLAGVAGSLLGGGGMSGGGIGGAGGLLSNPLAKAALAGIAATAAQRFLNGR